MRFCNHFLGEILSEILCLQFTFASLVCFFYDTSVLKSTPTCSSSEGRPFRLGTGANMEKVVKMDRDMTKVRTEFS